MLPNLNIGVYDADGSFKITDKKVLAVLQTLVSSSIEIKESVATETTLNSVVEALVVLQASSLAAAETTQMLQKDLIGVLLKLDQKLEFLLAKL